LNETYQEETILNQKKTTKISIITPCFNEEEVIENYYQDLNKAVLSIDEYSFEFIFIDDGSTDNTLEKLVDISKKKENIRVIELSRNFGKEAALTAGIDKSDAEAAIFMDADLEHPPEIIRKMIDSWEQGFDIILAKREDRSEESLIKKFTSNIFYKLFNKISDTQIIPDVGDFRLMNKASLNAVKSLKERQRFMKGILSWVGFKHTTIKFKVNKRSKGESKFSVVKLWKLAVIGIVSFSDTPLRIWSYIGLSTIIISFVWILIIMFRTLFLGIETAGDPALMVVIIFFGGLQLFSIGMIGEYLGRTYLESKKRPIYVIRKEH